VHTAARPDGGVVVASESCALDAMGARFIRDLEPGEIMVFDKNGVRSIRDHCGKAEKRTCIFEYIYFARPDSVIDGSQRARGPVQRAGECLALEHPVHADVVVGVPDSGLDAAVGYARQSGIPTSIGFIKNKYIGRTFISPTQKSGRPWCSSSSTPSLGGGGQARGADRRFHRPGHHLRRHRGAAAPGRRPGGAHVGSARRPF
jgi:glutamine phosphoribosylpyrophosphate amidotransferase